MCAPHGVIVLLRSPPSDDTQTLLTASDASLFLPINYRHQYRLAKSSEKTKTFFFPRSNEFKATAAVPTRLSIKVCVPLGLSFLMLLFVSYCDQFVLLTPRSCALIRCFSLIKRTYFTENWICCWFISCLIEDLIVITWR